jgi:hypothetical protein
VLADQCEQGGRDGQRVDQHVERPGQAVSAR